MKTLTNLKKTKKTLDVSNSQQFVFAFFYIVVDNRFNFNKEN